MKTTILLYLKGYKRMKENKKLKLMIIIAIVLIVIDQITKIIVQWKYEETIGNSWIAITLIENTGMAFRIQ